MPGSRWLIVDGMNKKVIMDDVRVMDGGAGGTESYSATSSNSSNAFEHPKLVLGADTDR